MLYSFLRRIALVFLKVWSRLEIKGIENVPPDGRLMVVANHVSIMDPVLLAVSLPRQIRFMGKSELFEIFLLKEIIKALGAFPVDRDKVDFQSVKTSLRILGNEEVLGIFPQGGTRKDVDKMEFRPGVAAIALKSRCPILPVGVIGTGNLKKMIFWGKLKVHIGEPINFAADYQGKSQPEDIAALNNIMEKAVEKLIKEL